MHIIGTAGHVDHGKSSLVQALTGVNPDRWMEEQVRGMTLDLGFAHLQLENGVEAGIIDVPGHERFLHNMLAGAAGMEVLLLVVAADEGVREQTVEHLAVLRFLNVRRTIVVVTKADLMPAHDLAFACEAIHEALEGTIAGRAPVVPVSNRTGAGIAELRVAINLALAALPARDAQAPAFLPVDRVFALPGHGTIVTGTLMQGAIAVGDALTLQPSQKPVRVRSLQSFGRKHEQVLAGARVAVNIPAVAVGDIARGEVLAAPQFVAQDAFEVRFSALPDALPLLRRRNAVRAYIGSAEILGTLVFDEIPVGTRELPAHLFLRRPAVAHPDTAFVVRRLSPKNVLGGGRISIGARGRDEVADGENAARSGVLAALTNGRELVLDAAAVARESNLRDDLVQGALAELAERGELLTVLRPAAYAHRERAEQLLSRAIEVMRLRQKEEPWTLGVTSLALARALGVDESLLLRVLSAFAEEGLISHHSGYFSSIDHVPKLAAEQQAFFEGLVPVHAALEFVPVPLEDVVRAVKQSRITGIGRAFDTLLAKGTLVKVNDDLYRGTQIAAINARVQTYLRANERMTMAQFRDLIGTTRKYAVPLLEWFDSRGITVRSGDYRMLRSKT